MNVIALIGECVKKGVSELYGIEVSDAQLNINLTRKEFEGDYTVVTFPFVKSARKSPEMLI
jgi:arginyl-tRNA synthetase